MLITIKIEMFAWHKVQLSFGTLGGLVPGAAVDIEHRGCSRSWYDMDWSRAAAGARHPWAHGAPARRRNAVAIPAGRILRRST